MKSYKVPFHTFTINLSVYSWNCSTTNNIWKSFSSFVINWVLNRRKKSFYFSENKCHILRVKKKSHCQCDYDSCLLVVIRENETKTKVLFTSICVLLRTDGYTGEKIQNEFNRKWFSLYISWVFLQFKKRSGKNLLKFRQ